MEKFAPIVMICMSILSAVGYLAAGDVRRTIYWLAAATITTVVTF